MLSDEWLQRYRLLENFTAKWNGNGNAYNRGDYNSSFALRAVELKKGTSILSYIVHVGRKICISTNFVTIKYMIDYEISVFISNLVTTLNFHISPQLTYQPSGGESLADMEVSG